MRGKIFYSSWVLFCLLIGIIGLQVIVLGSERTVLILAFFLLSIIGAAVSGLSHRRVLTVILMFTILLLPILGIQLLAGGSDPIEIVTAWSLYFARLVTAALIAGTYVRSIGIRGVTEGIVFLFRTFPSPVALTIRNIVSSSLFLIPGVVTSVQNTHRAARVRYSRPRSFRRSVGIVRAILIALLALPHSRAEAMIVRGVMPAPAEREQ